MNVLQPAAVVAVMGLTQCLRIFLIYNILNSSADIFCYGGDFRAADYIDKRLRIFLVLHTVVVAFIIPAILLGGQTATGFVVILLHVALTIWFLVVLDWLKHRYGEYHKNEEQFPKSTDF